LLTQLFTLRLVCRSGSRLSLISEVRRSGSRLSVIRETRVLLPLLAQLFTLRLSLISKAHVPLRRF
jgi:hypothetical protein